MMKVSYFGDLRKGREFVELTAFKNVIWNFLGNYKTLKYVLRVESLLQAYKSMTTCHCR